MTIACIGSGAFGVAIAHLLSQNEEHEIVIWSHDKNYVSQCQKKKKLFVKNQFEASLPKNVSLTNRYDEALEKANIVFILINSKYFLDVIQELKYYSFKNKTVFIGTKGMLSTKPYYLLSYAKKALKCKNIGYFAGPNFASDVFSFNPAVMTIGTRQKKVYLMFQKLFFMMKVEYTESIEALELASVLKNVYAIGAGLTHAKYSCTSSIVSYTSYAYLEMCRLLEQMTGTSRVQDIKGILGDFFLTNMNTKSRNFSYGIARFHSSNEASNYLKNHTTEGYENLENIVLYLGKNISYYPILFTIYDIIYKNKKADTLLDICFGRR